MTQTDEAVERAEPGHGLRSRWLPQLFQLVKFGAVGGVGVVVNFAVFNGLWLTVFNPAVMPHGPLLATVVATLVAIAVNWLGNRYWAFAADRQSNTAREGFEFLVASLVGMLVPLLCIGVSHYLLGLHSLLADNLSSNVVGLALGTVVRYALYKFWVYSPRRAAARRGRLTTIDDVRRAEAAERTRLVLPGADTPTD
jgi:putative flippase GtrA